MVSKPGAFSAYLESAQKSRSESEPSSPSRSGGALSLLQYLALPENHTLPATQLAKLSSTAADTFREWLKVLNDGGFVEISGPPLSETVKLTEKGASVTKLL